MFSNVHLESIDCISQYLCIELFSWLSVSFSLKTLDLSYNNLSPEDILPLGLLPNLRVLHLTGNGIKELPAEMSLPYHEKRMWVLDLHLLLGYTETAWDLHKLKNSDHKTNILLFVHLHRDKQVARFHHLEMLTLDDNRLSDMNIFATLASLVRYNNVLI